VGRSVAPRRASRFSVGRAAGLATAAWILGWSSTAVAAAPPPASSCLPSLTCAAPAPASAVVQFRARRQRIAGFGVATAMGAGEWFAHEPPAARARLLKLFFSPDAGAGFSMVRLEIGAGGGTGSPTIEPRPGVFSWVPLTLSRDNGQLLVLRGAQQLGVNQFLASAWSPPAWMKTGGSVSGGALAASKYAAYATYLTAYANGYALHYGIPITGISPASDPNEAASVSSDWSSTAYATFIAKNLGPSFLAHHVAARIVMPEQHTWTDALAAKTLALPAAAERVGVVAAHGYASGPSPLRDAEAAGKPFWQTEVSGEPGAADDSILDGLRWAGSVDGYVSAGASAWFWWQMVNEQSAATNGSGLVHLAQPLRTGVYSVAKRLWTIGNFSRFVRPGWYLVAATHHPAPGVSLTAFADPLSGRFAIVAVNTAAVDQRVDVALRSTKATRVTPYVTSATLDLRPGSPVTVSRGDFRATLEAQSVTTFVNSTPAAAPAPAEPSADRIWFAGFGALALLNFGFWLATRRWHLGVF